MIRTKESEDNHGNDQTNSKSSSAYRVVRLTEFLNNRGLVNPETEAKIREIAALLQYTPNKIGKTLSIIKKNIKFSFLIFSSTTSNPYFEDVVTGIDAKSKELEEFGVTV